MIASLEGEVLSALDGRLIVSVGGIGFELDVPRPLAEEATAGERRRLYTYLLVREDALTLYGFASQEDRDFFVLLLGVSGVGPRTALALLSVLGVEGIRAAVAAGQADPLARAPGIGKKSAERILFALKDKLRPEEGGPWAAPLNDVDRDVVLALTGLGYSVVEAQTAIQSLPRDAPQDLEARLRLALQNLAGG